MFHAGAGADCNSPRMSIADHVSRNTTRAIAGNFRFASIRIDQARMYVGVAGRKKPLHAISANPVMAVADAAAEFGQISRSVTAIHNQKVIATGGSFGKRDHFYSSS